MKIRQTKYLRNFWLALNMFVSEAVFPDLAIYWTLGNLSKPLATINLPKSPTFLGIWRLFTGHTGYDDSNKTPT